MKINLKSVTVVIGCLALNQMCFYSFADTNFSSWEDVTTPLLAGVGHEEHRGSAWCDYDNDGNVDLYVAHFGYFDPNGIYAGSANQLLKNIGNGIFEDATTIELEAYAGLSHHPAWGDIDNDGLPDIFISQSSNSGTEFSALLHQDSVGVFSDITNGNPVSMGGILPRGVGWQDIDNDGFIDFLVANSNGESKKNRMLINNGNGTFSLDSSLFSEEMRESRSIGWCDYDNDNLPDLYITNGAEDNSDVFVRTNQLYKNQGDGTWIDVAASAGVADIGHGRGQVWGDIDNDGDYDLFVGNQKGSDTGGGHNRLFRNNGNGTFTDITVSAGLFASFRTRCVSMADYDNDGYIDLYVVNFGNALPPNHLFRNNGNNTFTEVGAGTLASGGFENGSSASWADIDNDGWMDLYIVGGSTETPGVGMNRMLRNTNQNGNHWVEIELCGTTTNSLAIGSRVTVTHINEGHGVVSQMRDVQSGTGYNSGNMFRVHFGLGSSVTILDITIRWPSGIVQSVAGVYSDQIIRVVEDENVFAFDCNRNCVPDHWDIKTGESQDCNDNGIPDECDIDDGTSNDVNENDIPDECEPDCNLNGVPDSWDIKNFTSFDINSNGIPDECECIADIDGDGSVNVVDLLTVIDNWGETGSAGDINGDQIVGIQDLLLLIGNWGDC